MEGPFPLATVVPSLRSENMKSPQEWKDMLPLTVRLLDISEGMNFFEVFSSISSKETQS